jgi:hypothetical protein
MGHRALPLVGLLVLALAPAAARAGESLAEASGGTTRLAGYGTSAGEIYTSPAVTIDVNLRGTDPGTSSWYGYGYYGSGTGGWVTYSASSPEIQSFVTHLTFAFGLWENAPGVRLEVGVGTFRDVDRAIEEDGLELATLGGNAYAAGEGMPWLARRADGTTEIVECDLTVQQYVISDPAQAGWTTAHEVGHCLGFAHSLLNCDSMQQVTGATASTFVTMGYEFNHPWPGALSADDLAAAARAYPDQLDHVSYSSGAVRGRVLDATGARELYGAHVILVEKATGIAIMSRIAGYETSVVTNTAARDAFFALDAAPPGTYDVLVAAYDDWTLGGGWGMSPEVGYMQYDDANRTTIYGPINHEFASSFAKAWVRNVTVTAGRTINVGDVLEGTDRDLSAPQVGLVALEPVTVAWPRATKDVNGRDAEALEYTVELRPVLNGTPGLIVYEFAALDGESLRVYLPAATYEYRVTARWDTTAAAFDVLDWTPVALRRHARIP